MASSQEPHLLDVDDKYDPSRKIKVTLSGEHARVAYESYSSQKDGIALEITAENGVIITASDYETVHRTGKVALQMNFRAPVDDGDGPESDHLKDMQDLHGGDTLLHSKEIKEEGSSVTSESYQSLPGIPIPEPTGVPTSPTSSVVEYDPRALFTPLGRDLNRRSSDTDLHDLIAAEGRAELQELTTKYNPFAKVATLTVDDFETVFMPQGSRASDDTEGQDNPVGDGSSDNNTAGDGDASKIFDRGSTHINEENDSDHAQRADPYRGSSPEGEVTDKDASQYHASNSDSAPFPEPVIHATDPAFMNAKVRAQSMIGSFATAYSFDTDRHANHFEGDDNNVDWRLEELVSLILPYLDEQARMHLLSTNSLMFNACQQCICYVSEVVDRTSKQFKPVLYDINVSMQSSIFKMAKKFRFMERKKHGDEKITVVIYRGKATSTHFRDSAQHAAKSQQSFQCIYQLEKAQLAMAQDEATSRAEVVATKHLELYRKEVAKKADPDSPSEIANQKAIEARMNRFIRKVEARDFNVGIQVLEFQAAKHLRPEHILNGNLATVFRCLRQLGILRCEKFTIKDYPLNSHRHRAVLGPKVKLYWDFQNPQSDDWRQNQRKQLGIGSFLWQGLNWSVEASDFDEPALPTDPVHVSPNWNWIAFWFELKKYLEPEQNVDGDGTLQEVHNIGTLPRDERRRYALEQKKGFSPIERHVYDLFSDNYAKFPTAMRDFRKFLSDTAARTTDPSSILGADLINLLYPIKHGEPASTMNPASNDATLFRCSDCGVYMPGLMFEDAQLRRVKEDDRGICIGCKWIDKEDEVVNSPQEDLISFRFQTFLDQAKPQSFADFFMFDPEKDRIYNQETPLLPLMREFLKVCPFALTGQACKNQDCIMAVPKDFPPGKMVGKAETMNSRKHPFIQPGCRFALLDASEEDRCTMNLGVPGYDEEHCKEFCHDRDLVAQYKFCCDRERRTDHTSGRLNDRYWPTSTALEQWTAYLGRPG